MSWASQRQFIIVSIIVGVAVALLAALTIAIFYETPSCTDRKQNQDETGVDCGGSCVRVCESEALAPSVTFARALSQQQGRVDVIAYVANANRTTAITNARYTIELYDAQGISVAKREGIIDLPPAATLPMYVSNMYAGTLPGARAFLTFESASIEFVKYTDQRIVPRYNNDWELSRIEAPRIAATLTNPSAQVVRNVPVVATVFDAGGNAIAATQTLLTELPAQGTADVIFVWNEPFIAPAARVDVVPVVSL